VQDESEARILHQVVDVRLVAREQVVHHGHFIALVEKPPCQMRADKASTAGDQMFFHDISYTRTVA